MRRIEPDARLSSAAGMVRQGAVFADIGTDHAYLPVFLLEKGILSHAYAADIAEGPLERAAHTVTQFGLSDKVTLLLRNGLCGMEDLGLTDIAICGMGGETIVSILSAAPFVRKNGLRLILQPMTKAAEVRRYLGDEGFSILREEVCEAAGKRYFCLCAEYTGEPYVLSRPQAELGAYNLSHPTPAFCRLVAEKKRAAEKKLRGLALGGVEDPEEMAFCKFLEDWSQSHDGV